jgi:5'-nucleotidase
MQILLTNDDSHRSPLLQFAVDFFARYGTVHLTVPLHEQSWTGKSMSRFNPVHVQRQRICGVDGVSVSGTPADCVNLAINNIMPSAPDLVVSGINAGFNHGLGFMLSSGTLGACFEGNLAGVPAIAISQTFDAEIRNYYASEYLIPEEHLTRFRAQCEVTLKEAFDLFLRSDHRATFLSSPVTWNINLPFRADPAEKLTFAPLGKTRYGRCFQPQPALTPGEFPVFRHSDIAEIRDPNPECDSSLVARNVASISLINLWTLAGETSSEGLERICAGFREAV